MLLDALRDFEWLNEPLDVNFDEMGMRVLTHDKTDFGSQRTISLAKTTAISFIPGTAAILLFS